MASTTAADTRPLTLTRGPEDLSAWSHDLRDSVRLEAQEYSERLLLVAESFRASEGEPSRSMRWARATAQVLANCPVRIRRGERLVGWHPSSHPDEPTRHALDEARAYLSSQNYWTSAMEGHMALDNPTLLAEGLDARLVRVRASGIEGAELSLVALQGYIERYAALAAEMAQSESDAAWRADLEASARLCARIAHQPAETFREALQLMWFCLLGVMMEASTGHHCFGPGRIDQYLLPYLEADRATGRLDAAMVDDLLDQLLIKCNEFEGRNMSALILVIGGRRPDGSDGTNELSYRLLRSSCRTRLYFPGIDISWHRDMPADFVEEACALLRNGNGQPSFFHDDLIIAGLQRHGVPYEHAVDHQPSTCTETSIMGRCNPWVACPYVNLAQAFLAALDGAQAPSPVPPASSQAQARAPVLHSGPVHQEWEALCAALDQQLAAAAHGAVDWAVHEQELAARYRPFPLLSCFIQGCLESGRDISHGGALYNFLQPEAVGVSNVVDGLAAIKTLVFDTGRYGLDDFRAALHANWEGHEALRRAVQRECPKHGHDEPAVNDLFTWVSSRWCDHLESRRNYFGGPVLPGFLGWVVWIDFGRQTPATPDGRRAGEPLANSLAPCSGVRLKGIPSTLTSAAGLDHRRGLGGITFNLRFNMNCLNQSDGPQRLKSIIEAGLGDLGIYMFQVELAGSETLRAAQERPQDYLDLNVRIGGYLVPFTLLGPEAQREVIERAELEW
jgi:formate C-acetyltransferase